MNLNSIIFKAISDTNGEALFADVPAGDQKISYLHGVKNQEYAFTLSSGAFKSVNPLDPEIIQAKLEINIDATSGKSSPIRIILLLLVLCAIAIGVFLWWRRRPQGPKEITVTNTPVAAEVPTPQSSQYTHPLPDPRAPHAGMSLGEMIEEENRHKRAGK